MGWQIEYLQSVRKAVKKIDAKTRQRIYNYLEKRVAKLDDPRQLGKPLKGQFSQLWRYRIGDYRVVCELKENKLIVLVVRIAHRKAIYQR